MVFITFPFIVWDWLAKRRGKKERPISIILTMTYYLFWCNLDTKKIQFATSIKYTSRTMKWWIWFSKWKIFAHTHAEFKFVLHKEQYRSMDSLTFIEYEQHIKRAYWVIFPFITLVMKLIRGRRREEKKRNN